MDNVTTQNEIAEAQCALASATQKYIDELKRERDEARRNLDAYKAQQHYAAGVMFAGFAKYLKQLGVM